MNSNNKRAVAALNSLITNIITSNIDTIEISTDLSNKNKPIVIFKFIGKLELYTQEGDKYN